MKSKQSTILDKYKKHFKHLRILKGIKYHAGLMVVEAVTPDGRVLTKVVSSANDSPELEQVLEDWSPKK